MPIPRGNMLGAGLFVLAAISIVITKFVLKLPDPTVMIVAGIILLISDLTVRFKNKDVTGWPYRREFGGFFFFLPAWMLGLVVIIANIAQIVSK